MVGSNIASLAAEVAKAAVAKVYAIEDKALEMYTPDGFVSALKNFIEVNSRSWCCCRTLIRCATLRRSLPPRWVRCW